MNAARFILAAWVAVAAMAGASTASANGYHGGGRAHWHGPSVGFYYGGPVWWGARGYYGVPYAYVPPPAYVVGPPAVVTSTAGVVYIESSEGVNATASTAPGAPAVAAPQPAPAPAGEWWYLCASPRGAYPHVRECPGGWERVPAIPPGTIR